MKTLPLVLLFASSRLCLAAGEPQHVPVTDWLTSRQNTGAAAGVLNTNFIAVSDWSKIVMDKPAPGKRGGGLRARMLLAHQYQSPFSETILYLELQSAVNGSDTIQAYFDPRDCLHCKFVDSHGNPAPGSLSGNGGGSYPTPCWITLPWDATVRLHANTYAVAQALGSPPVDKGDFLELSEWSIPAGDTNTYYFSGTLTITAPTNQVVLPPAEVFQGTLELPKMKISLQKQ